MNRQRIGWRTAGLAALTVALAGTGAAQGPRTSPGAADRYGAGRDWGSANREGRAAGPYDAPRERPDGRRSDGGTRAPWEVRADMNHDGVVEPAEAARLRYQRWLAAEPARANRPWEFQARIRSDGRVDPEELRRFQLLALDHNGDGVVDPFERRAFLLCVRARATTVWEKAHDANGDGFLDPAETRQMMLDRLAMVKREGQAPADSPIERMFDLNGDGILNGPEAALLLEALPH